MMRQILKWINERWPLETVIRATLEEEIVGGSRYAYTLGSALFIVFVLQAASGVLQLFFYVPTVDHAYDSISFLRTRVPFGWLIHGLHYWGGNIMIVLVAMHMARVFIWGAYKTPRELTWLMGVTLLLTTMVFSFTGAPLHWDQRGYWAGEVGTSIAGTAPVVGDLMKRFLRGGEEMGQLTLSRFFAVHTMLLPAALVTLFGIHITAMRRFGSVGPWDEAKRRTSGPFWPDQVYKDAVSGTLVLFLLISLSVFLPPAYSGPADVLDTSYIPKPGWNFLFLYQALKYFQGVLEPVGTVGVPTVLVLLMIALPFVDRTPQRDPFKRPVAMFCGLLFAGAVVGLTIIGYLSPGVAEAPIVSSGNASDQAKQTAVTAADRQGDARKGSEVFKSSGCSGCHRAGGEGGTIGPELSGKTLSGRDRQWLTDQIRNPRSHFPNTIMPPYTGLSGQEASDLVDYLLSLAGASSGSSARTPSQAPREAQPAKSMAIESRDTQFIRERQPGPAAYVIGSADHGEELFKKNCSSCHGAGGTGNVRNPGSDEGTVPPLHPIDRELYSADAQQFAENIDKYVQHGSTPAGSNPALSMPAFGDTNSLTQQELAGLEAYVLRLNGVERGQLVNPGMTPRKFFVLAAVLYAVLFLVQGGLRFRKNIP
ncbi:MAG: cytochrome b N-terminal domain-containing protein [Nitrospiraceae bacterium]|nr:cytochrome b N-terminal domain-containing protein [Nitrospiraceae bacterium]